MGITKTDLFTEEQNQIAIIGKCFSHPARVAILQQLLSRNECINSELVSKLGLAQATISQHLKELKAVGIIKGTVSGKSMCYCIDPDYWLKVKSIFNNLFDKHACCGTASCC